MAPTGPQTSHESRQVTPTPDVIKLDGNKPALRNLTTGPAGSDQVVSRPLGYKVKALTLVCPDNTFKTGANTDSVYFDIEEVSFPNNTTPPSQNAPFEIPIGGTLTIEEVDPGWIHFGSPTANQRVFVSYGGPSVP